jgi:hypothetical protein
METTDSDLLITKATVILEKPSDWLKWLVIRKDSAKRSKIWEYVDPTLPEEKVKSIEGEKPQEKEPWNFKLVSEEQRPSNEEFTIMDLTEKELGRYEVWERNFTRKEAAWTRTEKAILNFNHEILRTIASKHIHLVAAHESPHQRLKALQEHLCPSTAERSYQLLAQYKGLLHHPKRSNWDSWLDSWLEVTTQMKEANLPEVTANRAQKDFLKAIQGQHEAWATQRLNNLLDHEQEDKEYLSINTLVAKYRAYYRLVAPIASGLGSFASLGVAEAPQTPQQPPQQKEKQQKQQDQKYSKEGGIICICEKPHKFDRCFYINQSLRPEGWKANPEIIQKFDKLRESYSPRALILKRTEEKLKKGLTPETSSKPQQLGASQGAYQGALHDDGRPQGLGAASYAVLQAASTSHQQLPLINRWILDPGSNTHVANSKAFGWRTTRIAQPGEALYAGGQLLPIGEWGEVELQVNTPTGRQPFKLTYVAYIPSFFTSVLGLSRCREIDLHFDSGRDRLYQKDLSNPVCYLEYQEGHWLIDADEKARPSKRPSVAATYQSKVSYRERKPLEINHRSRTVSPISSRE